MSRTILVTPWLFVAALSAQVPARPAAPPTPPRPAPAPKILTSPLVTTPEPWVFDMPDMSFDWSYAVNSENLADYARQAADYARAASDYAVNANLGVWTDVQALSDFGVGMGGRGLGGAGPVAWAQDDPGDSLYRSARDQLNRGDYRKAADLFKSLPQKYPNSAYVADAQYWQAFSLYRIGGTPELREALAVLEARKPDGRDGGRVRTTVRGAANESQLVRPLQWQFGFGQGVGIGRGQTDAAGLAARIASVLSSRGMSNDPAVKQALAAAGNACDPEDQSVRAEALNALMQNDPETGRQMAAKILANRDECSVPLRRNAVMLVGNRHDDAAVATLLPVAKSDPSTVVRMSAVEYLVRQQSDAAVNAVIDVARSDTNSEMQQVAVRALSQSTNPRARAEVRTIIENNNASESLRVSAIDGLDLNRISADDAAWLRALYGKTTSPHIKERIIAAVSRVGGDANNQWLVTLIQNDDEPLEARSAALSRVGRTMDIAALDRMYDGSSQRLIRETLLQLLSERKEPEALDKLVDIAKNGTDPMMRRQAISVLARSKDPRASKLLLQLVDR